MVRPFLFLICLSVTGLAIADPYTITFDSKDDFPGEPDQFIAAEFAGQLKKANPNTIQDGRFYLRQKFEDPFEEVATYQLYEGKATAAAGRLGKFTVADVPYTTLIHTKFFLNPGSSADFDIEKVYFDGKSVFVEGEDPIYFNHNGRMVKMESAQTREFFIDLSSQPSGATVTVNGEVKGTTPLKFSVNSDDNVVAIVGRTGFYNTIRVIKPVLGTVVQDGVLLTPKKELENPVPSLRARYADLKRRNDRNGMQAHRDVVSLRLNGWDAESKRNIEQTIANYPPNPGQRRDESSESLLQRTQAWEADRDRESTILEEAARSYRLALESLLQEITDDLAVMPVVAAPAPVPAPLPVTPPPPPPPLRAPVEEENEFQQEEEVAEEDQMDFGHTATDERDAAVDDAMSEVRSRFSNTDEYIRYGAYTLLAGFVGSAVVAILEHRKFTVANDAWNNTQQFVDTELNQIATHCGSTPAEFQANCRLLLEANNPALNDPTFGLLPIQAKNKAAMNSHQGARNLWIGIGGLALGGSIVLFTW